jgi:hypothetical protein
MVSLPGLEVRAVREDEEAAGDQDGRDKANGRWNDCKQRTHSNAVMRDNLYVPASNLASFQQSPLIRLTCCVQASSVRRCLRLILVSHVIKDQEDSISCLLSSDSLRPSVLARNLGRSCVCRYTRGRWDLTDDLRDNDGFDPLLYRISLFETARRNRFFKAKLFIVRRAGVRVKLGDITSH